ncbi:Ig-like domain-containing protein [uncultured Clostridium sp.]|uniref:Ig-like domain-containing protein n=2 Tax=uncultured Clostridium sp. TaxID=59620 RepID=UPI0027DADA35|nr:Ig-like domain-containing protein [uncultured Clostridium sp.]
MKRKLILMAVTVASTVAFSGFSVEANAAVNDDALVNVQNKVMEYINNYSDNYNAAESGTESISNTVGVNWNDYINNAGNSYKDTVDQIASELPEITIPETPVQPPETSEAPENPIVSEGMDITSENGLVQTFLIDNIIRIVHVGESYTINVLHSPGEVVFTSDNPEVATVDGNGNVVAVAPGKAHIIVSTADGSRTRKALVRVLGENELPDVDLPDVDLPDIDLPDIDNDINIGNGNGNGNDINIGNGNGITIDININKPSGNYPSLNLPTINWPTGGTTGGTLGSLGSANKISTTPTTLSSAKGASISTLPNTGVAIPLEAIGAISLLGGLGIYKKRK